MAARPETAAQKVLRGLHSRYPLIYLLGWEEERIQGLLQTVAASYFADQLPLRIWSASRGFEDETPDATCAGDPLAALQRIAEKGRPAVYLLKDLPSLFESDPRVTRAMRDLYYLLKGGQSVVFLSHPMLKLPETLKKELFLVDMGLPDESEIHQLVNSAFGTRGGDDAVSDKLLHRMVVAMKGLSLNEAWHLQQRLMRQLPLQEDEAIAEIYEEKSQLLRKESCLRFYPPQLSLADIGGLQNLKKWVTKRRELFTEEAFSADVPLPSGVLFMGVSGCGKSMAAKSIAAAWGLPLVRLDMSLVMSGTFGSPEYAFEHATRVAEEIAPLVLWIDELENSFGYDDLGRGAGNVNIFSSFLTWMQEKSPQVFLAATANRIQQLPAELMRKGRFDQLFFLDLPSKEERLEILRIHIRRNGGEPDDFELGYLAAATNEWNGAEIEQAVKSARIDAFQEDRDFNEHDVMRNIANMVPLSRTMKEQIKAIKDWSFNRAVPASA